jgi:hypothetical protein
MKPFTAYILAMRGASENNNRAWSVLGTKYTSRAIAEAAVIVEQDARPNLVFTVVEITLPNLESEVTA